MVGKYLLAGVLSCLATSAWAADYKGMSIQEGTLPIVLTAPHGGTEDIPGTPKRTDDSKERFVTVRDVRTSELAIEISRELERRFHKKPHYIVMRAARTYVDANRAPDSAYETDPAKDVYQRFHAAVTKATGEVRKTCGRGLLIDVHGQGAEKEAVFRGTDNGKTLTAMAKTLSRQPGKAFCDAMEQSGLRMIPPSGTDDTKETKYSGGYIVISHGSSNPDGIDAVQMEFGTNLRAKETLELTARETVDGLVRFCREAGIPLEANAPASPSKSKRKAAIQFRTLESVDKS